MSKLEFKWITEQDEVGIYQCELREIDESGNICVLRRIEFNYIFIEIPIHLYTERRCLENDFS